MEYLRVDTDNEVMYLAVDEDGSFHLFDEYPRRYELETGCEWLGVNCKLVANETIGFDSIPEQLRNMTWADNPVRLSVEKEVRLKLLTIWSGRVSEN